MCIEAINWAFFFGINTNCQDSGLSHVYLNAWLRWHQWSILRTCNQWKCNFRSKCVCSMFIFIWIMIQIRPDIRLARFLLLPFDVLSIVYSLLRFSLILVSSHISCVCNVFFIIRFDVGHKWYWHVWACGCMIILVYWYCITKCIVINQSLVFIFQDIRWIH